MPSSADYYCGHTERPWPASRCKCHQGFKLKALVHTGSQPAMHAIGTIKHLQGRDNTTDTTISSQDAGRDWLCFSEACTVLPEQSLR